MSKSAYHSVGRVRALTEGLLDGVDPPVLEQRSVRMLATGFRMPASPGRKDRDLHVIELAMTPKILPYIAQGAKTNWGGEGPALWSGAGYDFTVSKW